MELDGGAVGWFREPEVEILCLASFEKKDIVAVVEVGELVELVELGFCVKLGVLAGVGEEGREIIY